jgi:hypothetical protein
MKLVWPRPFLVVRVTAVSQPMTANHVQSVMVGHRFCDYSQSYDIVV